MGTPQRRPDRVEVVRENEGCEGAAFRTKFASWHWLREANPSSLSLASSQATLYPVPSQATPAVLTVPTIAEEVRRMRRHRQLTLDRIQQAAAAAAAAAGAGPEGTHPCTPGPCTPVRAAAAPAAVAAAATAGGGGGAGVQGAAADGLQSNYPNGFQSPPCFTSPACMGPGEAWISPRASTLPAG